MISNLHMNIMNKWTFSGCIDNEFQHEFLQLSKRFISFSFAQCVDVVYARQSSMQTTAARISERRQITAHQNASHLLRLSMTDSSSSTHQTQKVSDIVIYASTLSELSCPRSARRGSQLASSLTTSLVRLIFKHDQTCLIKMSEEDRNSNIEFL